mmetsp:Transcript_49150/g.92152  ORF Transcript_49150/g.92152 Transcript_49150/m.92152 type:complete len:302 (-) Transcript_49150:385-1290(-)
MACFIFASLALAAVTRRHMLSISKAANLFRMSSPKRSRIPRRFSSMAVSCLNFSTFLLSLTSSLRSVRSKERSALRIAASTSRACFSNCFFISANSPVRLERQSSDRWLALDASCFTLNTVSKLLLRWQVVFSRSLMVSAMSSFEAASAFFCSSGDMTCDGAVAGRGSPTSAVCGSCAGFGVSSFPTLSSFFSWLVSSFLFFGLLFAAFDLTGGSATCGDKVFKSSIICKRRIPVSSDKNFRLSLSSTTIFLPCSSSSKSSLRALSRVCFSEVRASVNASLNISAEGRFSLNSNRRSQTWR